MADPTRPHSRHGDRRGRGGRAVTVLPPETTLPVPRLPAGRDWTGAERKMWRSLWRSPMASQWDDAEAGAVAAYICHVSAVLAGTAAAWQAQEMRHIGNELGITSRGRLALGWQLPDPVGASVTPIRPA
jgi:hypothetical protein